MRRFLWILLFGLVLLTPFALRWAMGTATPATPSANASTQRIIVISPHADAIRTEFADAFSRWHQEHFGSPVIVDYRIYGGASDIVRYFASAQRTLYASLGTYKVDLVWGGGDDLFDRQLKQPGYLQGVQLSDGAMQKAFARKTIAGLPLYDQSNSPRSWFGRPLERFGISLYHLRGTPPQWFGTALSSFGIVYNRDVVRHLGLPEPKTWSDLADPRYRGWIVLADPMRSGVARASFMIVVERAMQDAIDAGKSADEGWARGMGLIRQIAANARLFTDTGSVVPSAVGSGDVAAGMAIDFQARSQVDAVQSADGTSRLAYIEPAGATAVNPDPIAMVKGAEHPELARRFIEFLLSEPGQRLWNTRAGAPGGPKTTSLRRLPIMESVYANPTDFTDRVNPYASAGNFNTTRSRTATFPVIGELIGMSCIDLLEDLRETRRVILNSSRAAELDAKLGIFPFDQKQALARAKQWSTATPLAKLELQRQWTDEFRKEYAHLRDEAK